MSEHLLTPNTGVTCAFGVKSLSCVLFWVFVCTRVSPLRCFNCTRSFLLPVIHNCGSFIFSCHSEYCWVALSLRKAFFGRPDQWRNRWEYKFMSVCSEYVCIQSESWATVCAFDHVRIACSLIEFDFHYMVFTSGLISYSTRCAFFFKVWSYCISMVNKILKANTLYLSYSWVMS